MVHSSSMPRTINLKDLCWKMLEHWKVFFLVSALISFLFMTFLFIRQKDNNDLGANQKQTLTDQEMLDSLPQEEQSVVESTYHLLQKRDQLSNSISDAPLMQIDPNQARRLRTRWAFSNNNEDVSSLAMTYAMELKSKDSLDQLIAASGVELSHEQFNDLLFVTYPDEVQNRVLCIDLFLTKDMKTDAMQETIKQIVFDTHDKLQAEFGEHRIRNYQSEIDVVSDIRLITKQTSIVNYYASLNNQINTLRSAFSADQKEVYAKLIEEENQPDGMEQGVSHAGFFSVRNALVGFLLGLVLCAGGYLLYCLLSSKVLSCASLEDSSMRILGEWYSCLDQTNKASFLIDRFVWKKHHRKHIDKDAELNKILTSLTYACRIKKKNSVFLVLPCECTVQQKALMQDIQDGLKRNNNPIICASVRANEEGFIDNSITGVESVVPVIIESHTSFGDIEGIFNTCEYYNIEILGCIYMG